MDDMEGLAEMMSQFRGMRGPAPDGPVPDR